MNETEEIVFIKLRNCDEWDKWFEYWEILELKWRRQSKGDEKYPAKSKRPEKKSNPISRKNVLPEQNYTQIIPYLLKNKQMQVDSSHTCLYMRETSMHWSNTYANMTVILYKNMSGLKQLQRDWFFLNYIFWRKKKKTLKERNIPSKLSDLSHSLKIFTSRSYEEVLVIVY